MQVQQRPRFRQDLVAEPIDDSGARFIDVMNPDTGNVFRFYEVEYSLACAMDGDRDVPGIVQWAKEELGLAPSANEVRNVIATLGDLGYLESAEAAAAAARTDGLAAGVVSGTAQRAPASNVELGAAGGARAQPDALPKAPELELGRPGIGSSHEAEQPKGPNIELGHPNEFAQEVPTTVGPSDVSLDLADQMAVRPDDVKEAVRASQVMRAVDVPPELLAAEPVKEEPRKVESRSQPRAEPRSEPRSEPLAAPRAEPRPEPRVEARPRPTVEEPERLSESAQAQGTNRLLIALLALVVIGAAGYFAYRFMQKKEEPQPSAPPPVQSVAPTTRPAEPTTKPAVETEKLAVQQLEPQDLKTSIAGTVETIVANDTQVKTGDVVAHLVGHKPIETEIAGIQRDIDKRVAPELLQAQKDRDAAQAAGNKAGVTTAEARIADRKKSLEDKQTKLAAKRGELEKFLVKAPVDGKVTAVAKANAKITPTDVVAKLDRAAVLVVTFKTASGVAPDQKVVLAVKEQKITCSVMSADATGVKVACPKDVAAEGADVTFVGPDTSAPPPAPPGGEIEMDEASGSGSAAPAAGSAAAPKAPTPPPPPPAPRPVRPQPKAPTPPPANPAPAPEPAAAGSAEPAAGSAAP